MTTDGSSKGGARNSTGDKPARSARREPEIPQAAVALTPEGEALAEALEKLLRERERWPKMGRASQQIIAGWGLDLFARNFWKACHIARESRLTGTGPQVLAKVLSFAL